jgi:crossover junction endodeoxyribonuclease RuvC
MKPQTSAPHSCVSGPGSRIPDPGPIRILGIDPGSQRTGVGIIEADATGKLRCVFRATLQVGGE